MTCDSAENKILTDAFRVWGIGFFLFFFNLPTIQLFWVWKCLGSSLFPFFLKELLKNFLIHCVLIAYYMYGLCLSMWLCQYQSSALYCTSLSSDYLPHWLVLLLCPIILVFLIILVVPPTPFSLSSPHKSYTSFFFLWPCSTSEEESLILW